jgi:hypothetical protein
MRRLAEDRLASRNSVIADTSSHSAANHLTVSSDLDLRQFLPIIRPWIFFQGYPGAKFFPEGRNNSDSLEVPSVVTVRASVATFFWKDFRVRRVQPICRRSGTWTAVVAYWEEGAGELDHGWMQSGRVWWRRRTSLPRPFEWAFDLIRSRHALQHRRVCVPPDSEGWVHQTSYMLHRSLVCPKAEATLTL